MTEKSQKRDHPTEKHADPDFVERWMARVRANSARNAKLSASMSAEGTVFEFLGTFEHVPLFAARTMQQTDEQWKAWTDRLMKRFAAVQMEEAEESLRSARAVIVTDTEKLEAALKRQREAEQRAEEYRLAAKGAVSCWRVQKDRANRLAEELRERVIKRDNGKSYCDLCRAHWWTKGEEEWHMEGCLLSALPPEPEGG